MLEYYRFKLIHDLFMKGRAEEGRQELADLQRRYVSLCDENTTFKMQMQEYEDILYLARNLVFDGRFYWLTTGGIKQGPFCPSCYDSDGVLMRLSGERGGRYCSSCRTEFTGRHEASGFAAAIPQEYAEEDGSLLDQETDPAQLVPARKAVVIPFGR